MATGPTVLSVRDLEVSYSGMVPVLQGVSLEVPAGAIVALLGANGAGKTTLLRAISGLLGVHRARVTQGRVELDGEPVDGLPAAARVRRGLAQVMEGRRIFKELTVDENLTAGGFTRRDRAGIAATRTQVLSLFPVLAERRRSVAGYLSGGEQQMLAIGRALMAAPRMLLLDEPSLGLAPRITEQIRDILVEIRRTGTSVLLVEQNATMALSIASTAYVLEHGVVAVSGPAAELADDPLVQACYLGAVV
jgi:branched-chain amino acid transport system ATP-binding protein